MPEYVLSFKPAVHMFGAHDPSAAIARDADIVFGVEEERLTRQKHAQGSFPSNSIESCLEYCGITLSDVTKVILPYVPKLRRNIFTYDLRKRLFIDDSSLLQKIGYPAFLTKQHVVRHLYPHEEVQSRLGYIDSAVPEITMQPHHDCHAASAFYPSGLSDALVLTLDGRGEYDSTVVWDCSASGMERVETYDFPNSLGHFYGAITEYLGYRFFNGEGKVMGLAPYGTENTEIESKLRTLVDTSAEYDVTALTEAGVSAAVEKLERLFGRERNQTKGDFDQWEKDLAHTTQKLLEEIVVNLVDRYLPEVATDNVALAGGVALNCKLNKRIMEMDVTDSVFIQPVAHDGGLALGALMLEQEPGDVPAMKDVYHGPQFETADIKSRLDVNKLKYTEPDDVVAYTAEQLADGQLVGWFQGRMEMGPRALGNRSILADPRTQSSLDRVNEYVKHREKWRPFAPSMLEEAMDDYLVDAEPSPYMIKTFETEEDTREEIEAVIHPADSTTRPQTVREDQNPRYYRLLQEFEQLTGTPVLLNTSFNDHGEPIVRTPSEAVQDFYGMGLDVLVLEAIVLEK